MSLLTQYESRFLCQNCIVELVSLKKKKNNQDDNIISIEDFYNESHKNLQNWPPLPDLPLVENTTLEQIKSYKDS